MDASIRERAAGIRLVIFDVDGVLTDGHVHYSDDGSETKSFHVRDGYGIRQLVTSGIEVAIISGRNSPAVGRRMKELGVSHIHQGCAEKIPVFNALLEQVKCQPAQVAFVGDDAPDIEVMRLVGLSVAVADAHADVAAVADWCTSLPGGHGAARQVCDLLLKARSSLDRQQRMTIRTAALVMLLLTAVVASRWLLDRPPKNMRAGAERTASAPGYYLRDATVLGTGRDGKPLYSLHAERIDEATDGAGARLSEINLEYRAEAADPWHLRADSGRISADGQTIELAGNVIITEPDTEEVEAMRVRAPSLTVDIHNHFASTEQRVRILRGASHLDGTGMRAFLSEGKLQLQSEVQGQYSQ